LDERVSAARWAGVVLIMIGAGLISYSEHQKENERGKEDVKRGAEPGFAEPR
jgi:hypothetical protein